MARMAFKVTEDKKWVRVEEPKQVVEYVVPVKNYIVTHLQKHQRGYTTALMTTVSLLYPTLASASTGATVANMEGGKSLILLLQQASFWVGMGITIWGIVEAQMDFPGWRGRIAKGVLGYIGILLVPLVFMELQNSLQVDIWTKIDEGMN